MQKKVSSLAGDFFFQTHSAHKLENIFPNGLHHSKAYDMGFQKHIFSGPVFAYIYPIYISQFEKLKKVISDIYNIRYIYKQFKLSTVVGDMFEINWSQIAKKCIQIVHHGWRNF